jgi:hypothetical protein
MKYFDCNEGDIKNVNQPTQISLVKPTSQEYSKTINYYNYHEKPKVTSFASLNNDIENINSQNNYVDENEDYNKNGNPVRVEVIVPMEEKKILK